jgi:ElaB/YqjD/DUF883 family membrane-anchored ribosome-binding protein
MQNTGMQGSTPGATSTAEYAQKLAEQASSGMSRLSESAHEMRGRVQQVASQAAGRLGERGRELMELEGRAVEVARTYIREHPVAAIGIAIAIGLIISKLTSRR